MDMSKCYIEFQPCVYNQGDLFVCPVVNQFQQAFLLTAFIGFEGTAELLASLSASKDFNKIPVLDPYNFDGDFYSNRAKKTADLFLHSLSSNQNLHQKKINRSSVIKRLMETESVCHIACGGHEAFLLSRIDAYVSGCPNLEMIKEPTFVVHHARNKNDGFDSQVKSADLIFASLCLEHPFFVDSVASYLHVLDYINLFRLQEINKTAISIDEHIVEDLKNEPLQERHPDISFEISPTPSELLRQLKKQETILKELMAKESTSRMKFPPFTPEFEHR
jgi:hypothetical protein